MDPELIFALIAITWTACALWTDLKNRWVPDWINYSLIAIGLFGHLILSIKLWSIAPILYSLCTFGVIYLIGLPCIYFGLFGGGDIKLMAGLGAILATTASFGTSIAPWHFIVTLALNIMLAGAVVGVLFISWIVIKHRKKLYFKLKQEITDKKLIVAAVTSSILIPIAASIYNSIFTFTLGLWILFYLAFILLITSKIIENETLTKTIRPAQLIEGDWLINSVKIENKIIYEPKKMGIEQADIEKLIALEKQGKLSTIEVKDGAPYVLAIFIGLIVSLFFGDLMMLIIRGVLNG